MEWYDNKKKQEFTVNLADTGIVFNKDTYGLTQKNLSMIKNLNINEIEVCGTDTDACVLTIAYQLFDNNIKPIILTELCGSSSDDKSLHEHAIKIMGRSFSKNCLK